MPSGHLFFPQATSSARQSAAFVSSRRGLPNHVQEIVPICAQFCLSSHIKQNYNLCDDDDISCLCSQYGSEFTLGEFAYVCVLTNCPNYTWEEANESYNICAFQSNAVSARHSTLTIPPPPPTPTPTSSQLSLPPVQTATISTAQSAASGMPIPTASNPETTSSAATEPASLTGTKAVPTSLTTAQALGISIAAIGAVSIAIGLIWLFVYRRRRRATKQKAQRHSYDFIDDAPPRFSPSNLKSNDQEGILNGFGYPRFELSSEKRKMEWPSQYSDGNRCQPSGYSNSQVYESGQKKTPNDGVSIPPASHPRECSSRTTSQLLPDKPTTVLAKPFTQPTGNLLSPATAFEEVRSPAVPVGVLPGLSGSTMSSQRPAGPHFHNSHTKSPERMLQPPLALQIPRQEHRADSIQDLGTFSLAAPPTLKQSETENRLSERSLARTSNTSLLNYYSNADQESSELYTPIDEQTQIRRPPPIAIKITKPTYPPRAVRVSTTSDQSNRTSFESNDSDEPTTPEEEEKPLTPLAESPIATIRYPKIPRSSGQAVPRSPVYPVTNEEVPQSDERVASRTQHRIHGASSSATPEGQRNGEHTPTLSSSTLAAKRRGDSLANSLEQGLHIKHSNVSRTRNQTYSSNSTNSSQPRPDTRHGKPPQGYGRVTKPSRPGPDWPLTIDLHAEMKSPASLKSPMWEPKLTPRRMGDDLYLDLSLATPVDTHFHCGL